MYVISENAALRKAMVLNVATPYLYALQRIRDRPYHNKWNNKIIEDSSFLEATAVAPALLPT